MEQLSPVDEAVGGAGNFSPKTKEKAVELIIRVLKFLQEFDLAKTPPILNLAEQSWKQYFDGLPDYSMIQFGAHFKYLNKLFENQNLVQGNFILKSGRPTESVCPPPPVVVENWLKPGWETPDAEPQFHSSKTYKNLVGKTVTEGFDDSPERLEGFEDWLEERRKWAASEIHVHEAMNVFGEYFDLWSKLHRESEKFQLFVGDGIFCWESPNGIIRHPLLIQKVQLEFNSLVPEFVIRDAFDTPALHTAILRFLGIDGRNISHFQQILTKSQFS